MFVVVLMIANDGKVSVHMAMSLKRHRALQSFGRRVDVTKSCANVMFFRTSVIGVCTIVDHVT
jgi:hypothetical protein